MINNIQIKNTMKTAKKKNGLPVKCLTTNTSLTPSTAGSVLTIAPPAQGVGVDQRTGDEIEILDVELSAIYYGADAVNFVRTIVVQMHGFTPALSLGTILQNGVSGVPDVTSLYVPFYEGKFFTVLYDKIQSLVLAGMTAGVADRQVLKPKITKMGFVPTTTQSINGQLVVLVVSDSAIIPHPTYDYSLRTWFRDI